MNRKLIIILFTILVLGFYGVSPASSGDSFTVEEATKALQGIAPGVKVLSVQKAAVEGLWEVVVEMKGRKSIIYIDEQRKNIILGSIIDLQTRRNITKEKYDEINRIDISQIPLDDALIMGNPKAKHRVIVFDDPD
jgi:thiol:disulfide interchange protein DsbC